MHRDSLEGYSGEVRERGSSVMEILVGLLLCVTQIRVRAHQSIIPRLVPVVMPFLQQPLTNARW